MIALPRIIVKRWRDAGVDILVNNAGMGRNDASLFDGNTASWVEMVSTNTLGVCMCTREALQVQSTTAQCELCMCTGNPTTTAFELETAQLAAAQGHDVIGHRIHRLNVNVDSADVSSLILPEAPLRCTMNTWPVL